MTIEADTPHEIYTVSGTGPYAIPWPYQAGTIRAAVAVNGVYTELASTAFTVSPASGASGNVTLKGGQASTHAGRPLLIRRLTLAEQGWEAQIGAREAGLEAQLDQTVMKLQEIEKDLLGTLRVATNAQPIISMPVGRVPIWDGTKFVPGPSATDIANAADYAAQAAAAAALALAGTPYGYPTRAAMLAASIGYAAPATVVRVAGDVIIADGERYRVAPSGATDHDFTCAGGVKLYAERFERIILMIGQSQVPANAGSTGGDMSVPDGLFLWNNDMSDVNGANQEAALIVPGTEWVQAKFGTAPLNIGTAGSRPNNIALQMGRAMKNWNGVRRVYFYTLGVGGTLIENLIKPATLAAKGWTLEAANNLTGILYGPSGIRAAINAITGRSGALLDGVVLVHGGANITDAPWVYAAKMKAIHDDLTDEGLIDPERTPYLASMLMTWNQRSYVMRHLSAIRLLENHIGTFRHVDTVAMATHDGQHLTGSAMTEWGARAAAQLTAQPQVYDLDANRPLTDSVEEGLYDFTDHENAATRSVTGAPWKPVLDLPGMDAIFGGNSGWQFRGAAGQQVQIARRKVFRAPMDRKFTIRMQASSPTSFALGYRLYTWTADGTVSMQNQWFNGTPLVSSGGNPKFLTADIYPASLSGAVTPGGNVMLFPSDAVTFTWGLIIGKPADGEGAASGETRFRPIEEGFWELTPDEQKGFDLPPNVGTELTIASGSITVRSSRHLIDTEADAATDDLTDIDLTYVPEGALFGLAVADNTRDVVIRHIVGNIRCGEDRTLTHHQDFILFRKRRYGGIAYAQMVSFADNMA